MGPTMPPSRKAQSPSSGASPPYQQGGGLAVAVAAASEAEAADLSLSLSASFSKAEDEELTSLSWLHEGTDLLSSFSHSGLRSVSPLQQDPDGHHHHHHHHHHGHGHHHHHHHHHHASSRSPSSPSPSPDDPLLGGDAHSPYDLAAAALTGATRKPPYSFSCLIFMAIEDAPNKRLPVKDIYGWILEHFPYFASAPTGWKNSVRHNLSLNKCFKKVDKDRSQSIGKGSLWSIDPEYRHNLIQALKKTPYHPYSPGLATPSTSPPTLTQTYQPSTPLWSGSPLFRKNGAVLLQAPRSVIQNGARMRSQGLFPVIRPLPVSPVGSRTTTIRSALGDYTARGVGGEDSPSGDEDAQDDHTYSTAKSPSRSCSSSQGGADSSPPRSPPDDHDFDDDDIIAVEVGAEEVKPEPREIPLDLHVATAAAAAATATAFLAQQPLRAQRRGSGAGSGPGAAAGAGPAAWTKNRLRGVSDTLPLKKRRAATAAAAAAAAAVPVESDDEEMKEAAGSLLHLAGVRACLNNITNRTAKGQKEQKETLRN